MSGPENTFIAGLHRLLPADLYRMKNHNPYNSGIADCWYSGKRDLWIEYKFIAVPKRGETLINLVGGRAPALSCLQQEWLKERHAEGRNVGVIVGCKDGGAWYPGITWNNAAINSEQFHRDMMPRKNLAKIIHDLTS